MAQDPAFLFYTNDFERGVQFFSDEQVGMYLRLLMAQHQHGHLTEKQMRFICKSYDIDVIGKFTKDENGLFFNERLELEINRRKSYIDSRSKNKSGKIKDLHKDIPKIISKSYDNHMEDENEIENVIKNEKEKRKGVKGEKQVSPYVVEIIEYLNELNGTRFRTDTKSTNRHIEQRIKEGYSIQELREIVEYKVMNWKGTEWDKWLQPDTLFAADNCAKYRNQVQAAKDKGLTANQIKGKPNGKVKPTMEGILDIIYNKQQ